MKSKGEHKFGIESREMGACFSERSFFGVLLVAKIYESGVGTFSKRPTNSHNQHSSRFVQQKDTIERLITSSE